MRSRVLCLLGCLALLACGGEEGAGPGPVSSGGRDAGAEVCSDADGDGFGVGCDRGVDCDDSDVNVTNGCRLCLAPKEGCPCTPGTKPMSCDPEDIRTTMDGVSGRIVCKEGFRYCRDGQYSDCEIIQQYARFVAD